MISSLTKSHLNFHLECLKNRFSIDPNFCENNKDINWYNMKSYYDRCDKETLWIPKLILAYANFQV